MVRGEESNSVLNARKRPLDSVRGSRDGHEFHEAWVARKALQLLSPDSDLSAIAVEGLSPADQLGASSSTVEIADITLYFGGPPTFQTACKTTIAQFKYSIANQQKDFRASHAKKTIQKFANAYREYTARYGTSAVRDRLDFQIVTNQPIYAPFLEAIDALARSQPLTRSAKAQAEQFKTAANLTGKALVVFAGKLKIIGRSSSLSATKHEMASLLVDWSATNDALAKARLGQLKQLVRDKAGHAGAGENLITRTDILATLDVADPADLLPCENRLVDVGEVVRREQLKHAIALISTVRKPLLVHSAGGVGKTVFMDSLAKEIRDCCEVVFFDCFGGGAYRSPEDARHLPNRGLMHIVNTLAFRGLCDPILPGATDVATLLTTFRRRVVQCVSTMSRTAPGRQLAILIDAIDNAELIATQQGEECFPLLLLKSLHTTPLPGLKLIVSCRTERRPTTYAEYHDFELQPFSKDEVQAFLRTRLGPVSQTEINVAQARSRGNPSVLDYLATNRRRLLYDSEADGTVELDELIQERITEALSTVAERGYTQTSIDAFLAGLGVLPPPIPIDEYAHALGIETSAVESFASDLHPLLEHNNHGLVFRDEPTETFVRDKYRSSVEPLRHVADRLLARQHESAYAARALPNLLHQLDDGTRLFDLAFDERIPAPITSTVGQRNVRYARLKAAVLHAASKRDSNRLVRLLLELSTIAAVDERGSAYIRDYPDLVVAAKDVDASRRLFEMRTRWPGTRHASLATANTLSGDFDEATRHAQMAHEWIGHYCRLGNERQRGLPGPKRLDIAAIPFHLISQRRFDDAGKYLRSWPPVFASGVCRYVLDQVRLAQAFGSLPKTTVERFIDTLTDIGPLVATLSFGAVSSRKTRKILSKISSLCKKRMGQASPEAPYWPNDGLRRAAAIALSLGLNADARTISSCISSSRPSLGSFREPVDSGVLFAFLFRTALVAAEKGTTLHEKDILPEELVPICSRVRRTVKGAQFRDRVNKILPKHRLGPHRDGDGGSVGAGLSDEETENARLFVGRRLEPLLALTAALSRVLRASPRTVDNEYTHLLRICEKITSPLRPYEPQRIDHFVRLLSLQVAISVFSARQELRIATATRFLHTVHALKITAPALVEVIDILARREPLHELAGEQARKACSLIEDDDEVEYRASLFGKLGRAMLSASIDEASVYFRRGLEQLDAIGSGDYEFTQELLNFASVVRDKNINERSFHTLTNILELNMGDEPEKWPWGVFGRAFSRTGGLRGFAKLSRWDDRSTVSFANTLLPYLTALVNDKKISPQDAVALNYMAKPRESFECGTKEFAQAIRDKAGPDAAVITELIQQFAGNNPELFMTETVGALAALSDEALGASSETTAYLKARQGLSEQALERQNAQAGHNNRRSPQVDKRLVAAERAKRANLEKISDTTDPVDRDSLSTAIDAYSDVSYVGDLERDFFASLRAKVSFGDRSRYVSNIFSLENLSFYGKLNELQECRKAWADSSLALGETYQANAIPFVKQHADDLIHGDSLWNQGLEEISGLTNTPTSEFVLELVKLFARRDKPVSGVIWLTLASIICPSADNDQGRLALERLLESDAAKLADKVTDGVWREELYPEDCAPTIISSLVWRGLGSPGAADRWRAAHTLRCFGRLGRWEIVDSVIAHFDKISAGPFQAVELAFYYLHAQLWLLVALARMAIDHPEEISRYQDQLLRVALEQDHPHVLQRHFAAKCLLQCVDSGALVLGSDTENHLRYADASPHQHRVELDDRRLGLYNGRPLSVPMPTHDFSLDYDFRKYEVDGLARAFGRPYWEVADMVSEAAHRLDPPTGSMHETRGRKRRHGGMSYRLKAEFHTHGQQLGWHALLLVAGDCLKNDPLVDGKSVGGDPWEEWLESLLLTRNDGWWLSDGIDRQPLDTLGTLLENRGNHLAITGEQEILLSLAHLKPAVIKELVVDGNWQSEAGIRVQISSALVPVQNATRLARELTREDPLLVWVPHYGLSTKKGYTPWILNHSVESGLDEHDPYGVDYADERPSPASEILELCSLKASDAFGRVWSDKRGKALLRAQAWGRGGHDGMDSPHSGRRLFCSASVLRKVLRKYDADLLLLIKLERYEEQFRGPSKWTHTIGVVRIDKALKRQYFKGRVNHLNVSRH